MACGKSGSCTGFAAFLDREGRTARIEKRHCNLPQGEIERIIDYPVHLDIPDQIPFPRSRRSGRTPSHFFSTHDWYVTVISEQPGIPEPCDEGQSIGIDMNLTVFSHDFVCPVCGLTINRNLNSARNILKRALVRVGRDTPEYTPVEIKTNEVTFNTTPVNIREQVLVNEADKPVVGAIQCPVRF